MFCVVRVSDVKGKRVSGIGGSIAEGSVSHGAELVTRIGEKASATFVSIYSCMIYT